MTNISAAAPPARTRHYQGPVDDSDRWDGFQLRAGDILICTAPKCGTTWTQMICALIVHQSARLPQPLTRLSRWVERVSQPIETVDAEMGAQTHRRVIKSHTPLDGLPFREDVSYVVCGRDPRDAFLSGLDHFANLSLQSLAEGARRLGLPEGSPLPFPSDPNEMFVLWLTMGPQPWIEDGFPMGSPGYYAKSFWPHRGLRNIHFTHYIDLKADLDGEMRAIAAFLGAPVDEAIWPELARAASFEAMKAHADEAAPGAHLGEWRSNDDFFHSARLAQWRSVLTPENQAKYETLNTQRLAPALKLWLEGGRRAADPKTADD
jgi:aryl sulfotransferase